MPFKEIPPYYHVWKSMRDRCYNPKSRAYSDYGGRGIVVCDRWRNSYSAFAEDMGPRPAGCSIDRKDNDGNYEPGNCRWSDRKTQQRNQRRAVYVVVDGQRYRAIELAELHGIKVDTIVERAQKGLPLEMVVTKAKMRDLSGLSLGGQASGAKKKALTHCKRGHEFTPENTSTTPQGWRVCRECHNDKMRRRQKQWRAERV